MTQEKIILTSLDYAQLIQLVAQKFHMTILNKTQINKILFIIYGIYLAQKSTPLFTDDTPKAWPFGPVFPKVYKNFNAPELVKDFSEEKNNEFKKHAPIVNLVIDVVERLHNVSAFALTQWSHKKGSPWYNTIYKLNKDGEVIEQKKWGTKISESEIQKYFTDPQNNLGFKLSNS